MHDHPDPAEILSAATRFVREELVPALPPALSFNARVLANALDLVARQITENAQVAAESLASIKALLQQDGPEEELMTELSRRIEAGELALDNPALTDYLWKTTLAKLAVDQPKYASYRAEIETADN